MSDSAWAEETLKNVNKMSMEELLEEFFNQPKVITKPMSQRRVDVINALRKTGEPLMRKLKNDLKNPDPKVKVSAEQVLANIGETARGAVPELIEALDNEDITVRSWAVMVLGPLKDPRAFHALVKTTYDPSPNVRSTLLIYASPSLSDALFAITATALSDEDKIVRNNAIYQLKLLKDKRAAPLLMPLLDNKDVIYESVRRGKKTVNRTCDEVVLALEHIINGKFMIMPERTEKENDLEVQKWKQWWKENRERFTKELYPDSDIQRPNK